jgi:YHS domain-containing protein
MALLRDPVCGMDVALRDAVASAMIEDERFYFCCLRCHAAFLDTPHRFVGWAGDPHRPLAATAAAQSSSSVEHCRFAS